MASKVTLEPGIFSWALDERVLESTGTSELEEIAGILAQLDDKVRRELARRRAETGGSGKPLGPPPAKNGLTPREVERYSRQLLLPEFGVRAQLRAKLGGGVLVVGCGGLGCPSIMYLVAAGVGRVGVVDHDVVEVSNLQRQVFHTEQWVGRPKAESIKASASRLNPDVQVVPFNVRLDPGNARDIVRSFDVVVDATDNAATRYLINDACILENKPLVSGSALRFEGQLTVYNYRGGPTYRCLFPQPPPPETVTNCSDGGVMGAVTGVIGSLQALESLKIIAGATEDEVLSGRMLLFDGLSGQFKVIRLRPRQGQEDIKDLLPDYDEFCGGTGAKFSCPSSRGLNLLTDQDRLGVIVYKKSYLDAGRPHLLVDVRSPPEMEICSIDESAVNVPISELTRPAGIARIKEILHRRKEKADDVRDVIAVCRRGNDSQKAVIAIRDALKDSHPELKIRDLIGGLYAWHDKVDPDLPLY